jgi:acyl transferase domain-containing protein
MLYRMGESLYQQHSEFRAHLQRIDDNIRRAGGESIIDAVFDPGKSKEQPFDHISQTHPAIFGFEMALAHTLNQFGVFADMTVGVSLGSFAAAVVSGSLSEAQATAAVVGQGLYFEQNSGRINGGKMLAVMAHHQQVIDHLTRQLGNADKAQIASYNGPRHCVISVRHDDLVQVYQTLDRVRLRYMPLPVNYPFHSSWMAEPPFDLKLDFCKPKLPQMCTASATVLQQMQADYLWSAIQQPIQWQRSVEALAQLPDSDDFTFVDLSPSGTLAALLKQYLRETNSPWVNEQIHSVYSLFGGEKARFDQLIGVLLQ